jgi:hypothetical protein
MHFSINEIPKLEIELILRENDRQQRLYTIS